MIELTETAIAKINEIISTEEHKNLRMYIEGGGCSGFQYGFGLEDDPAETDIIAEFDGFQLFVDPMSLVYLDGVSVDYEDGLNGTGFRVKNPNATGKCGCGHSFSV